MRFFMSGAASFMLLATPLYAQQSSSPSGADGTLATDIETVVVTGLRDDGAAQTGSKTGTPLRDVPASVVVIAGEVLRQQEVRTLDAALSNASAVAPNFAGGYGIGDNYVIRGLPMRFLRDGLPEGPSFNGYRRTLADVASIAVLKGPGSALYGRAEAGGSVNLITLAPTGEAGVSALASYGRFDTRRLVGDATAQLGGGLGTRLIGNYEQTDGFRGLGQRFYDVLPTVTFTGDGHRVTLDYDYRDQRQVIDNYGQPFTVNGQLAPVDREARYYSPFNISNQKINRVTLADEYGAASFLTVRAALVYEHRDLSFVRNAGGNPLNTAGVMTGRTGRTQSDAARFWTGQFEAVFTGQAGAVASTTLLGAEWQRTDIDTVRRNYALADAITAGRRAIVPETAIPTATTLGFDREIDSETLSVYGQQEFNLADRLKIRAGGRYDGFKLVDDGLVGAIRRRIAGSPGLFSWQAGAVYTPSRVISLYGGYAKGEFVAITTEATALTPLPERSTQIEAGVKAASIGGQLNIDLAVFETKRDRYFVALVPGADPLPVGRQRTRGIELDMAATPATGFTILANGAYLDAKNRSAALASVPLVATNQSVFGKFISSTPRWSGSVWANWEPQTLPGASFGAGAIYRGRVFVDALELLRLPDQLVAKAAVGYRIGPVQANVVVDNLFGETWYRVPTFIGGLPGEPRSVKVTLRAAI